MTIVLQSSFTNAISYQFCVFDLILWWGATDENQYWFTRCWTGDSPLSESIFTQYTNVLKHHQWPPLLIWINFNPSMDKQLIDSLKFLDMKLWTNTIDIGCFVPCLSSNRWPKPWWHHQMETFSMLLALCEGNLLVTGGFPSHRPVMWSFNVFFDLHLNKRLSKQLRWWWVEMPMHSLWCPCNELELNGALWHACYEFKIWFVFLCHC